MKKTLALALFSFSLQTMASPVWLSMSSSLLGQIREDLPMSSKIHGDMNGASVLEVESNNVSKISSTIHRKLHRCGGFVAHESKSEAIGILSKIKFLNRRKNFVPEISYEVRGLNSIHSAVAQVSEFQIYSTIEGLSSMKTRHHQSKEGRSAPSIIAENWKGISKGRSDISVDFFSHRNTPQNSVILTIEGASRAEEIVILGAHLDSIVGNVNDHAPGADDNASGIASVTEALRLIVANGLRPERTIKLIAYAAEEVGLVGSKEIAKAFKKDHKKVVGVLQLDMTLYKGTDSKDIVLVGDYTDKRQNEFLGTLIDEYVKVPWGYTKCGYGCSDHASWDELGYPASFPFESEFDDHNPNIHTSEDTLASSGGKADHAVPFAQLGLAFLLELGL